MAWDWLSTLIAGIIVFAIGFIINRVFSEPIIKKIGYVVEIIGIVIIVIAIILLAIFLIGLAA